MYDFVIILNSSVTLNIPNLLILVRIVQQTHLVYKHLQHKSDIVNNTLIYADTPVN